MGPKSADVAVAMFSTCDNQAPRTYSTEHKCQQNNFGKNIRQTLLDMAGVKQYLPALYKQLEVNVGALWF